MKNSKGLTGRQEAGILALVESGTVEGAARDSGIGRTTLHGWLKDENFRARLEAARSAAFDDGLNTLKAAASRAARRLIEMLDDPNRPLRFRAAVSVLEIGMRAHAEGDIEARISRLEEAFSLGNPPDLKKQIDPRGC